MSDTFQALGQAVGAGIAGAGFSDLGNGLGAAPGLGYGAAYNASGLGYGAGLNNAGIGYGVDPAGTGLGYGAYAGTGLGYGSPLQGVGGGLSPLTFGPQGVGYGGLDSAYGTGVGFYGDAGAGIGGGVAASMRGDTSQQTAANNDYQALVDAETARQQAAAAAAMAQNFTSGSGAPGSSVGVGDLTDSKWAAVNKWDSQIVAAANATGVPANLIKAVMLTESGGDPNAVSPAGAMGLMQVMPDGGYLGTPISQSAGMDPNQNVLLGAKELAVLGKKYNGDWTMALRAYHGFGPDGFSTDVQYAQAIMANKAALDAVTQTVRSGGSLGGGVAGSINAIWGGGPGPGISQPYGTTDFSNANCGAMYAYAAGYGCACCHPGVDEAVSYGTKLYAPVGGTVVCAGEGVGTGDPSSGCNAFCSSDTLGCQTGTGRFEMKMDNGDYLILGHMSAISGYVTPGEHISAGQLVGLSGAENGAHVHVEVRQVGNCPVGMCTVDPTTYFGSASAGAGLSAGGFGGGVPGVGSLNGPGMAGGSAQGAAIVAEAQKYLGDPYVWNTHGPNTFDCSGLVSYVVGKATGMQISTGSHYQFTLGTPVSEQNLAPGDLVFWDTEGGAEVDNGNTASHVGIYIGNGQVLAAMNPSLGVKISTMASMDSMYPFLGGRRLFAGANGSGGVGGSSGGYSAPIGPSPYVTANPQTGSLMDLYLTGSSPGYA